MRDTYPISDSRSLTLVASTFSMIELIKRKQSLCFIKPNKGPKRKQEEPRDISPQKSSRPPYLLYLFFFFSLHYWGYLMETKHPRGLRNHLGSLCKCLKVNEIDFHGFLFKSSLVDVLEFKSWVIDRGIKWGFSIF